MKHGKGNETVQSIFWRYSYGKVTMHMGKVIVKVIERIMELCWTTDELDGWYH